MKQRYKLETITPVHIGSGDTLNQIDGYFAAGRWYHIDLDKVLVHPNVDINTLTSQMAERGFRWNNYLSQCNLEPTEFSRYHLSCVQNPETTEIRNAIKSVGNRPYIPGSSIKGAIRTVLLEDIIAESEEIYNKSHQHLEFQIQQRSHRNPRTEKPAQKIEQFAFGKDPNHDLLRTLQVSDTEPLNSDSLEIGMAWTVTVKSDGTLQKKIDRGQEYKNFVQQIQPAQTLIFTLKIDDLFFRDTEKKKLGFSDMQQNTLNELPQIFNYITERYIKAEQEFYSYYRLTEIANFYDNLIQINGNLKADEFLLQVGWGTGYISNTITNLFTDDEELPIDWMGLRQRFQLGKRRSQHEPYDENEFPKTRRILYQGDNPIQPLGWVKLSLLQES